MGRYINKGEHGIQVFVPIFPKGTTKEQQALMKPSTYILGKVFDVAQTNGKPLPEVHVPMLEGEEGMGLEEALEAAAILKDDAIVQRLRGPEADKWLGKALGLYVPALRRILVRDDVAQLSQTKTLAHEYAHHIDYRQQGEPWLHANSDELETVAEASAYVTLKHFGYDSGARSFKYIAVWSENANVLKKAMGRVQRVSSHIIDAVEGVCCENEDLLSTEALYKDQPS
jgi:hypothetical protein